MSIRAKILQKMYKAGKITEDGLVKAVLDGVITREEYELIINS